MSASMFGGRTATENYVWNTGTLEWDRMTQPGGGGGGSGTEYTEDNPAAANPLGPAVLLVRQDTPAALVSADGDNVAQRATNYGAAYTQILTSTGSFVDTFGGGTQYTEDAAAAADPVGNAQILVRQDTPSALVSANGDNVARRGTNYGAAFTQIVTSTGSFVDTFGGGTQYTEDAASAADPVGTQLIARRRDTLATETTTDGDVTALNSTGKGELYVKQTDVVPVNDNGGSLTVDGTVAATQSGTWNITNVSGTISLPTGASTLAEQQTQTTALQLIDDIVHASDAALSKVAAIGAQFDDVSPGTTTENNIRPLRMSTRREMYTQIRDAAGNERGVNVNDSNQLSVSVDNTPAVTVSGTVTVADNQVITDNAAFTDGTSKVFISGYIYDEVAGTALTENDAAAARINVNRAVVHTIEDGTTRGRYATVTASNAVKVDGSAVTQPVSGTVTATLTASSSSVSSVAGSATSVSLLTSNASRKMATFFNDSTSACYIKFGTTASTTSFTIKLFSTGYYEMPIPCYTGAIDCIWDSATGNMRITELT